MLIRLLRTHLRPYRKLVRVVVAMQIVQSIAALYIPRLNARIIDRGVATGDTGFIWSTGLVMIGIALVQGVFAVGAVHAGSRVAAGFGRDVRNDLFHRVTAYSAREVSQFGPATLITRITNDVQQVQVLVQMTLAMLVAAPIMAAGGVVMAVREDIGLSLILLVSVPALLLAITLVISRMVPLFRVIQEQLDGLNRILREQLTGMRVVRAFVREPDEAARFSRANAELTTTSLASGRLMSFMFPTVVAIINVSSVAVVWFGANRISRGAMSPGAMIAFLSYLTQILMSVMMATFITALWPRAAVSAERIVEVLDTDSSVVAPAVAVVPTAQRASIEFRSVGFVHPGAEAPVLDDVTFSVVAGQTLAIIGSTGSGKTTLLSLVPRLFDVTAGSVMVDGVDVRDLAPDNLWGRIGLVPQRPFLFTGTIASNLRYGRPDATDDELWEALTVAQAADFVRARPSGLAATIVQGGSNVSGGQRQRIAIARALVRRPAIYLFDDSFSALDLATDARLRASLVPHVRDAVVLIVGQRVSTIRNADQILVLEGGRCVGLGNHTELLGNCPTYVEIVESQLRSQDAA